MLAFKDYTYSNNAIIMNNSMGVCSVMSHSMWPHGPWPPPPPTRVLYPWSFLGKNTGVGCHFLTPEDFPDPGIKPTSLVSSTLAEVFFTLSHLESSRNNRLNKKTAINSFRVNYFYQMKLPLTLSCKLFHCSNKWNR